MDENSYLLQHVLGKLEKLQETAMEIRLDQAEIKADLREHMRRTNLLEDIVLFIKKEVDILKDKVSILIAPWTAAKWVLRVLKIIK